jgi:hypothetical protein
MTRSMFAALASFPDWTGLEMAQTIAILNFKAYFRLERQRPNANTVTTTLNNTCSYGGLNRKTPYF